MKRTRYITSLVLFAALVACSGSNGSGNPNNPDNPNKPEEPSIEVNEKYSPTFTLHEIPMKQARSAKRGMAGGFSDEGDIRKLSVGAGWYYNWGHSNPAMSDVLDECKMTYYPMVWNAGLNRDFLVEYGKKYPNALILGYNEPNLTDQANMTPSQAAEAWPTLRDAAQAAGLKLISPALNYGTLSGYHDPVKWMTEFVAHDNVSLDDMAGIALHCYMPNVGGMRNMVHLFDRFNKPIYMTEFCHANGTITNNEATQMSFMADILNFLESDPAVGGYSWFMTRANGDWGAIRLVNGFGAKNTLTSLGKIYAYFSSFDKNCYYNIGEPIPAEHYSAHNMCGKSPTDGWIAPFGVDVCDDKYGDLVIVGNQRNAWVEYQINVETAGTYALAIRYKSLLLDGEFDLTIDNGNRVSVVLPQDDNGWRTHWVDISLPAGKHTMRLSHVKGRADINWFYFM